MPTDADGDTAITYTTTWTVDSSVVLATTNTLTSVWFSRGDDIFCTVTPSDVTDAGLAVASNTVTVENSVPSISSVSVTPSAPSVDDTLACVYAGFTDADGDADASTYEWTIGGPVVGTGSTVSGVFSSGDTVTCTVTPSDGTDTGTAVSGSVTEDNTPPSIAAVSITPASPTADDTLTCSYSGYADADGDADQSTIAWTVNGAAAGASSVLAAGACVAGDSVVCEVTPLDGIDTGVTQTPSLSVGSAPPSIASVSITPSTAQVGDTLTCSYTGYTDPDGDPDQSTYSWTINGTSVGTSSTLSGGFSHDDIVVCTVTPFDGSSSGAALSDSITIDNSAPLVSSVSVTPTSPASGDTLTCSYSGNTDADGDADLSTYSWTISGTEVGTSSTLSSGLSKGDTVVCTVTVQDGNGGTDTGSDSELIENSAPSVSSVTISPSGPVYASTLTVSYTSLDPDGDSVVVGYAWSVNGAVVSTGSTLSVASYAVKGDSVSVTLTPTHGFDAGVAVAAGAVSTGNTAPTSPVVDATDSPAAGTDDIVCAITTASTDVDTADTVSYVIEWEGDGAVYPDDFGSATGPDTTTYTDDTVPAADNSLASSWTCYAYATDGTADSADASDTPPSRGSGPAQPARAGMGLRGRSPAAFSGCSFRR